jgi:serine/threonine protein kinase
LAVDDSSLIGSTLGDRYRLLDVIGEGGMGRVFRAEQLATGQTVALKLLHPEFSDVDQVVQRFVREGKVTTQLSHPNVVQIVEFGEWNGRLFLAMELLAGKSLAALIQRDTTGAGRRMTLKRTMEIIGPVLSALQYAHSLGVIHRDLKPENIMVIPARGLFSRERVKLLDFGIAKLAQEGKAGTQALTQLGFILGTPGYMSPEQALGQQADVRSDVYSCGVILYEMLTGRRAFEADSNLELMTMQLNSEPRSFQAVAAEARIAPAVECVVRRAMARRPDDRFESVRDLQQALASAVDDQGASALISGTEKTVLAVAATASGPSPWSRLAVVAAATAILIGDHLPPLLPGSTQVYAGDEVTAHSRERSRRPTASVARDVSSHPKRADTQPRLTAKSSSVRPRRPRAPVGPSNSH